MRKRKNNFTDLSLRKKIMMLFLVAGILPLCIAFWISYRDMKSTSIEKQQYVVNQNYEQISGAFLEQINRIEEISAMLVVDDTITEMLRSSNYPLSNSKQIEKFNSIYKTTTTIIDSTEISSIIYYVKRDYIVTGADTMFRPMDNIEETDWYQLFSNNPGEITWVERKDEGVWSSSEYLTLCRAIWDADNYGEIAGIITINVAKEHIESLLSNSYEQQGIYIQDKNGTLVSANNYENIDNFSNDITKKTKDDFSDVTVNGIAYLYRYNNLGDTGLYLISVLPYEAITFESDQLGRKTLFLFIGISIFVSFLIIFVTKSITKRMNRLTDKIEEVQNGRLEPVREEEHKDEVGRLIISYNYMIEKMQHMMEDQFIIGQEKKGAELRALQAQINPHFLYNTLDMISWMAAKNETKNIQQLIRVLSRYYKLVLNRGDDIVTMEHEMQMCSSYMDIQLLRFKGRVQYICEIDEELGNMLIPKITFQPLLENAILHGINQRPEGRGTLTIRGQVEGERVIIQVIDDGMGFKIEDNERVESHGSGYGLKNIEMRLNLFFNQEQSMKTESTPGIGTCVTINIPIKLEK